MFEEEVVCSYQDKAALGSEVMINLTSQIIRYKEENPNWRRRKGTAKLSEKKGNGEERRGEERREGKEHLVDGDGMEAKDKGNKMGGTLKE